MTPKNRKPNKPQTKPKPKKKDQTIAPMSSKTDSGGQGPTAPPPSGPGPTVPGVV